MKKIFFTTFFERNFRTEFNTIQQQYKLLKNN